MNMKIKGRREKTQIAGSLLCDFTNVMIIACDNVGAERNPKVNFKTSRANK